MAQLLKIEIICFCGIILIFFFVNYLKLLKQNRLKKEDFINYLVLKKDMDSLYKFGFYNNYYSREERRVPFLDKLIIKKYEETKDEKFLSYYKYIKKASLKMIFYFFSMFVLFCICMILI